MDNVLIKPGKARRAKAAVLFLSVFNRVTKQQVELKTKRCSITKRLFFFSTEHTDLSVFNLSFIKTSPVQLQIFRLSSKKHQLSMMTLNRTGPKMHILIAKNFSLTDVNKPQIVLTLNHFCWFSQCMLPHFILTVVSERIYVGKKMLIVETRTLTHTPRSHPRHLHPTWSDFARCNLSLWSLFLSAIR